MHRDSHTHTYYTHKSQKCTHKSNKFMSLPLPLCIMHTYTYIYIHIYIYVYVHIHTYTSLFTCLCILYTYVGTARQRYLHQLFAAYCSTLTYELLTSSRHLLTQVSVPECTQNMLLVAVLVWVVLVSVHLMTLIASRAVVRLRAGSCDPSKLACTPA